MELFDEKENYTKAKELDYEKYIDKGFKVREIM